jgi:hypothetical protein
MDGYDGIVFNRWYADMVKTGVPIEWDEMLWFEIVLIFRIGTLLFYMNVIVKILIL